jgi:predicted RNase H-like nuclease
VRYLGVDLAWGSRGRTGLALVTADGTLTEATRADGDDEILAWLAARAHGPCLVAFDAPVIVRNRSGSRRCERLVGRYFGASHASCHPVSRASPLFADGGRALRLARALDLDSDPAAASPRRAVEVYPHPAIVSLAGLPSIIRYKRKPGRDLAFLRAEMIRLLAVIESLAGHPAPVSVRGCPDWERLRQSVTAAAAKADLARAEDAVDAVMCASIARIAAACPGQVRLLGTSADGCILTPVTAAVAARIDADGTACAWHPPA